MSAKVTRALIWLNRIFHEHQVPYQIVGGLAASIHGGQRPVADIDLYIPAESSEIVLTEVRNYLSKPMAHYVEHGWDVDYFQLLYQEQKIEIGLSPGSKVFDSRSGQWTDLVIDYSQSVAAHYHGVEVTVMPLAALIAYKSLLGREVDLIDIRELTQSRSL